MSASFPMPADEPERLAALRRYEILDTPPEDVFDRVTQLAASLFAVPRAFISFVDADRQWFKARVGIEASETPRAIARGAHTILSGDTSVILDARRDERFRDNFVVHGAPGVRFYVGAPLVTRDGHCLGVLGVADGVPRAESRRKALPDELRLSYRSPFANQRICPFGIACIASYPSILFQTPSAGISLGAAHTSPAEFRTPSTPGWRGFTQGGRQR